MFLYTANQKPHQSLMTPFFRQNGILPGSSTDSVSVVLNTLLNIFGISEWSFVSLRRILSINTNS